MGPQAARPRERAAAGALDPATAAGTSAAAASGAGGAGGAGASRVQYACRGCRTVLFGEGHVLPHLNSEDLNKGEFSKDKKGGGGGKKGSKGARRGGAQEAHLCSMHFLKRALPWMEQV